MLKDYYGIKIDLSKDEKLTEFALNLLKDYYVLDSEKSPQESFARAALAYSFDDIELAQRIYEYASKGWFMYSSPILSNASLPGPQLKVLSHIVKNYVGCQLKVVA